MTHLTSPKNGFLLEGIEAGVDRWWRVELIKNVASKQITENPVA